MIYAEGEVSACVMLRNHGQGGKYVLRYTTSKRNFCLNNNELEGRIQFRNT